MRRASPNRGFIISGFAICNLIVCVLAGYFLSASRHQHEQYAETVTQNIAKAIDQNLTTTIEKVDVALRSVLDEFDERPEWGGRTAKDVEILLDSLRKRIPTSQGIMVTDAKGMVIYGRGLGVKTPVSYANRDFFSLLRENQDAGLQISQPSAGCSPQKWSITLARRYTRPNGSFGGVIVCSIPVEHFNQMISQFDIGARGGITLLTNSFLQIASHPKLTPLNRPGSHPAVSPELKRLVQSGIRRASFHTKTPGSSGETIVTFHRLTIAPLIATVGVASDDYLEQWHNDVITTCGLVASFLLLSLVSAVIVLQAVTRTGRKNAELYNLNAHLQEVIDEYQLLSDELRESERRYSALFANKLNAIAHCRILTDADNTPVDYLTLRVNEAFERIIGIKRRDIEGRKITEVFPGLADSAFDFIRVFGQIALEGGETQFEAFFEPTRQYLSIYAYSPLPSEFATIITDVTERKRSDEALRVSESKLRIIFDNEVYAICIFDFDTGLILDVNETHVLMYGYSREELCSGMYADQLVVDAEGDSSVQEVGRRGTMFVPLRYHRKKDGTVFPVEIVGGAYQWNGRRVMFGLVHDITERVKAEESLKRYAQRLIVQEEDLRKKVSMELHDDIGQELTALGLNLAFIGNTLKEGHEPVLLSTLEDSRQLTKEISRTVRNLMVDLRPSQLEEYGLAGAIRSYADQYRQRTGLEVVVQVDEGCPRLHPKQEIALFRIVQEALNNAAKYAAATQVSIALGVNGSSLQLSIADDGQGFVPRETNLQPTGSGWGLTIMRERAELAGGSFRLNSVAGVGTMLVIEFREYLDADQDADDEASGDDLPGSQTLS